MRLTAGAFAALVVCFALLSAIGYGFWLRANAQRLPSCDSGEVCKALRRRIECMSVLCDALGPGLHVIYGKSSGPELALDCGSEKQGGLD